jgi:hypothetical protein
VHQRSPEYGIQHSVLRVVQTANYSAMRLHYGKYSAGKLHIFRHKDEDTILMTATQNVTAFPVNLSNSSGKVQHVGIIIFTI